MISKYDAIDASVKNAQKSNIHSVMIAWGMVFLFVLNALFFSIIEDKKELNVFSKILLFLFMLVILFYSVKNFRFYIERNIQ
jgi:ABC-type Na+ efflux pump permease subunit